MKVGAQITITALEKGFQVCLDDDADSISAPIAGLTTPDDVLAFIRSRMGPEGEGEKPLDKLQRLGQEYDATPTDPPWRRAKVGDWVLYRDGSQNRTGKITGITYQTTSGAADRFTIWDEGGEPNRKLVHYMTAIKQVFPTPPRHGDFGSRPEEDGA